jgi:hypothetical protein
VFQPKTLFVMGAGASTEFNFPTGAALMNIIKEKLVYDEAKFSLSDAAIHRALLTHVNRTLPGAPVIYGLSDYVDAARQIVRAMPLSASIDTFMDDHRTDARIQLCGKLAIVKAILEAEGTSKAGSSEQHDKVRAFDPEKPSTTAKGAERGSKPAPTQISAHPFVYAFRVDAIAFRRGRRRRHGGAGLRWRQPFLACPPDPKKGRPVTRERNSGSYVTRRWREMDSNPRSPGYGRSPSS